MIARNFAVPRLFFHKHTRNQQLFLPIRQFASHEDERNDKPLPFLDSPAAQYEARRYRASLGRTNRPSTEPLVVAFSLSIFLIYFCILREENDIDKELSVSLYDRLPGLSEPGEQSETSTD